MKILSSLLAIVCLTSAASQVVLRDLVGEHVLYHSLLGPIEQQSFIRQAVELLKSRDIRLGVVVDYPSSRDRTLGSSRGYDHCSYGEWRSLIEQHHVGPGRCPALKEVIKLGSDAVFRSIDEQCHVVQFQVIGSSNPLLRTVSGVPVEILDLSPDGSGRILSPLKSVIAVFAQAAKQAVSEELTKSLTNEIRELTGGLNVSVSLRSDRLFLDQCGFPAFYGFGGQLGVIWSEADFRAGKEFACGVFVGQPVRCFRYQ